MADEISAGVAIGFQAFYIISVLLLAGAWILQFNRLTALEKEEKVAAVEKGSAVIAGAAILVLGLEMFDPFKRWDIIDGPFLRLLSLACITCNALWLVFNGAQKASVLLVVTGQKLKAAKQHDDDDEDEDVWDNYTRAKYLLVVIWAACMATLAIFSFGGNQEGFIMVYIVAVVLGLCISVAATLHGLYKAYEVKLGSRDIGANDVKKKIRTNMALKILMIIGYHIAVIGILVTDLGFGVPTGGTPGGDLATILIVYAIANRIFISFELWFYWYSDDERSYSRKLQDRRKKYKIISVEKMIDDRLILEKKQHDLHMPTVVSPDILDNVAMDFDIEDEEAVPNTRGRGFTKEVQHQAELQYEKGSRKAAYKDEEIPDQLTVRSNGTDANASRDSIYQY